MRAFEIKNTFIKYFKDKKHLYLTPSNLVNYEDPDLMFTNAGMNQLKKVFLGQARIKDRKLVNSQPCLRISGKHNDIEEVGIDMYHHTLFEMLGNWSINDYFKKEAIEWAWELLTKIYKLNKKDLYVTVFGGDENDNISKDTETYDIWKGIIEEDHILFFSKKDNFWEMGERGPCGPCTEIHIDIRSEEAKEAIAGATLVNTGHPEVIELWNIVFIQYERLEDKTLKQLKEKFVDTGMGFERLCMVLQNKKSTYDTDIFSAYMRILTSLCSHEYNNSSDNRDIAFRVISDHVRTIILCLEEGLVPSNIKEGYVLRMLIRRAQKYGYMYLGFREPFLHNFISIVAEQFKDIKSITDDIKVELKNILIGEEIGFLKVINNGRKKVEKLIENYKAANVLSINGEDVFKLKDTYGLPVEITELILKEHGMTYDKAAYKEKVARIRR